MLFSTDPGFFIFDDLIKLDRFDHLGLGKAESQTKLCSTRKDSWVQKLRLSFVSFNDEDKKKVFGRKNILKVKISHFFYFKFFNPSS
jgi:hypothetical protein